ncbi:MAG: hypothetical protein N2560_08750 [Ignavibacteria bacterium]|nr:hypothetical protein [Ignavibacteria bacterium]
MPRTITLHAPVGGGNLIDIFQLATNAFGTKAYSFDNISSVKSSGHPKQNKIQWDIDQIASDETFYNHLNTYLSEKVIEQVQFECEDGTKLTYSTVDTTKVFGYTIYFGALSGKRKVFVGCGTYSGETGGLQTGNKAFEKTTVQITGIPAPATYSLPTTIWNTDMIATTGAPTQLAKDSYGTFWFATAV